MRGTLSVLALASLAACSDPLDGVERFSEMHISDEAILQALPSDEELQRDQNILQEMLDEEAGEPVEATADLGDTASDAAAPGPAPRKGVFGWLKKATPTEKTKAPESEAEIAEASDETPAETAPVAEEVVKVAAVAPVKPETTPETKKVKVALQEPQETEPPRKSRTRARATAANVPDVTYGDVLPFGKVARVCEARAKPLGKRLERSETRGLVYAIYDSNPGSAAARTFYVTGFADNCPRQFTASLAMFGAPRMHEQLRYGRPGADIPYSETDAVYEKVKTSVCRVPMSKPCGQRIDLLERSTVFISAYERFSDNGRWADVLIHKGAVVATATKDP